MEKSGRKISAKNRAHLEQAIIRAKKGIDAIQQALDSDSADEAEKLCREAMESWNNMTEH